jgi:lipoate-protein ligase A
MASFGQYTYNNTLNPTAASGAGFSPDTKSQSDRIRALEHRLSDLEREVTSLRYEQAVNEVEELLITRVNEELANLRDEEQEYQASQEAEAEAADYATYHYLINLLRIMQSVEGNQ